MVETITVNGKPDTETIAHFIVIKVLNESLVKYHGTRLGNDEVKDLTKYVKGQLVNIKVEAQSSFLGFHGLRI